MVRQPIFTREKLVWGYEIVTSSAPSMAESSQATCLAEFASWFRDTLSLMVGGLAPDQKIVVNVTKDNINCTGQSTDWSDFIFNLCPDAVCASESDEFVSKVREGGGSIALDGDAPEDALNALVDKSDFIKVSLVDKTPPEVVAMRKRFRDYSGHFLVGGVDSWQAYEGTRALGFDFFQGSFFALPEIQKDRKLSAGAMAKMQLIQELGNPDCKINELANIISSDVSLSYRILKYINSASFGLKNEITSIQQALSLLGLKEVKHWAMVVVMSDLDTTPKGEELAFLALQRARFLSQLVQHDQRKIYSSDSMFILGLFSKLDALLSFPMEEALEDVPIDLSLKDALCGIPNDYRDWLLLLDSVEVGNWGIANSLLEKFGIGFQVAATEYLKSSSWAAMQLPDIKNR